jgi:hypothetical protein
MISNFSFSWLVDSGFAFNPFSNALLTLQVGPGVPRNIVSATLYQQYRKKANINIGPACKPVIAD